MNKINVYAFGGSAGQLIFIHEIQTEKQYGGIVTYKREIHQI